jgi:putative ABC transport system permease protein
MMADSRPFNRSMFWRIERRLLSANRGRVIVILLALGAGAAVSSALLNLQVDAKRRLTTEFRAFGPNVVISPREGDSGSNVLSESLLEHVSDHNEAGEVSKAGFLYGLVSASNSKKPQATAKVVLVGYTASHSHPERVISLSLARYQEETKILSSDMHCAVGEKLASSLNLQNGGAIQMSSGSASETYSVFVLQPTGGPEDSQVFIDLPSAQRLLAHPNSLSLIQVNVPGTPRQITSFVEKLQANFPGASSRPIRQFTEGEARIYSRISGILNATVAVILILTAFCVMAAMTSIAMERRNDVALMKAIGGTARRVLRFFLVEATLLGFVAGVIGAAIGLLISIYLGKAVFGVASQPRIIVYPVSVLLTVAVAILGAFPLRRLAAVRPASIFRGEQ